MTDKDVFSSISAVLVAKLEPLWKDKGADLNLVTCVEVYSTIFDSLVEVLSEAAKDGEQLITNEGMNYLAQQFYDGVRVNGTQELDPDIFTQRAGLGLIETKELVAIAAVLAGSDFALPVLEEIRKRS